VSWRDWINKVTGRQVQKPAAPGGPVEWIFPSVLAVNDDEAAADDDPPAKTGLWR
jgi:hypothetical protein